MSILGRFFRLSLIILIASFALILQACGPVRFLMDEASSNSLMCVPGHEVKCRISNGWGVSACTGESWTECAPDHCDVGFELTDNRCQVLSCETGGETSCSAELNNNLDLVGVGLCNVAGQGTDSCKAWSCLNGSSLAGELCTPDSCNPGDKKICHERNGKGESICQENGKYGACLLSSCEEGFQFNVDKLNCESVVCKDGNDISCETQWGPGFRSCKLAYYSPFCTPNSCPSGYEVKDYGCWPTLCPKDTIRNAQGTCEPVMSCTAPFVNVANKCVCPSGTMEIGTTCGTCQTGEVYDVNTKSCLVTGCSISYTPADAVYGNTIQIMGSFSQDIVSAGLVCSTHPGLDKTITTIANGNIQTLVNIQSPLSCQLNVQSSAGNNYTCAANLNPSLPPPTCTKITLTPANAPYNSTVSVVVEGTAYDTNQANVLTCNGVDIALTPGAQAGQLVTSLPNVKANQSCTAKLFNAAMASATCPQTNLTVQPAPPPTCTGITFVANPYPYTGNLEVLVNGTNLDAARNDHNVTCATTPIPLLPLNQQTGTVIKATLNNSTLDNVTCSATVWGINGNSVTCPVSAVVRRAAPPTNLACNTVVVSPTSITSGGTVNIAVTGEGLAPTTTAHSIKCGATEAGATNGTVNNVTGTTGLSGTFVTPTVATNTLMSCFATVKDVNGASVKCSASNSFTVQPGAVCTGLTFKKVVSGTATTVTKGTRTIDNIMINVTGTGIDPTQSVVECSKDGTLLPSWILSNATSPLAGYSAQLDQTNGSGSYSCSAKVKNASGVAAASAPACTNIAFDLYNAPTCTSVTISPASLNSGKISAGGTLAVSLNGSGFSTTNADHSVKCGPTGNYSYNASVNSSSSTLVGASWVVPNTSTAGNYACTGTVKNPAQYSVQCPVSSTFEVVPVPTCTQFEVRNLTTGSPTNATGVTLGDNVEFRINGTAIDPAQSKVNCLLNSMTASNYNVATSSPSYAAPFTGTSLGTYSCTVSIKNAMGDTAATTSSCPTRTFKLYPLPTCTSMALDASSVPPGGITASNLQEGDTGLKMIVNSNYALGDSTVSMSCSGTTNLGATYTGVNVGAAVKTVNSTNDTTTFSVPLSINALPTSPTGVIRGDNSCTAIVTNGAGRTVNCTPPPAFSIHAKAQCTMSGATPVRYNTTGDILFLDGSANSTLKHVSTSPAPTVQCLLSSVVVPTSALNVVTSGGYVTQLSSSFTMLSEQFSVPVGCTATVYNAVGRASQCSRSYYPTDNCRFTDIPPGVISNIGAPGAYNSIYSLVKTYYGLTCNPNTSSKFKVYDAQNGGIQSLDEQAIIYEDANAGFVTKAQTSSAIGAPPAWNSSYMVPTVSATSLPGKTSNDFRLQIKNCDNTPTTLHPSGYCGPKPP